MTIRPIWMDNYAPGYIGFEYADKSAISTGIAYFTRWERMSALRVTHCFVVETRHSCVEALARGVVTGSLQERFVAQNEMVFFRKPAGWTPELGERIAELARKQVGKRYDVPLIAGQLVTNLWLVRTLLPRFVHDGFANWLLGELNSRDKWICSELAAFALDEQPELRDLGVLATPNEVITPQALFEDDLVFKPWQARDDDTVPEGCVA